MPRVTIDNQTIEVAAGTTILQAARQVGIEIPTLCYLDGCTPTTSCMACVVKRKDNGRLVPSCAAQVEDGLAVESQTDEVQSARREALELLLSDHPGDCIGPCQTVCPAHMDIPQMLRALTAGDTAAAAATARSALVLPATLGRICPAPCEKGCRRGDYDAPLAIRLSHRHAAESNLKAGPALPACKPATGKRVAIIGAGAAGLAAAWRLLQEGIACTIFDENDKAGGVLRRSIPQERLPHAILDAEADLVRKLGAELRLGAHVGRDIKLADLQRDFQAVIVATGENSEGAGPVMGVEGVPADIQADRQTGATSVPGLFSAGATGPRQHMAVRAVAHGAAAAAAALRHLAGKAAGKPERVFTTRLHSPTAAEMAALASGASPDGRTSPAGGEAAGLSSDEAQREAPRCLHCDCRKADSCKLRHWAAACETVPTRHQGTRRAFEQDRRHPLIIFEPGKCISCGLCLQITERAGEPLGLAQLGRGFGVRIDVPLGHSMAEGLQKVAAEVVAACPTGALAMK